jgi:methylmalonyl-CoA/ethylmalonyl-CoA epimerase
MITEHDVHLSQIGQIAVNVKDVDRATAFYRDTLGMTPLFRYGNLSFFDCGGVRLMLGTAERADFDHPGSIIYFKVSRVLPVYQALAGRAVSFEGEPHVVARMPDHDLWMAFFRDSENNMLALMSEERKQQA